MVAQAKLDQTLFILSPLIAVLPSSTVLTPTSPTYTLHSEPFAIQKQLHPPVVFVPATVSELSKILAFLYKTGLDFAVRGRGFKSPSAEHVIISMMGFNGFEYNAEKLITVGVGCSWRDVVERMEEVDPEYNPVAGRTPATGVGGTILTGGLSWMSTEYGAVSDPINFIDAEVVKFDGTVVMASQEPELLWALRGGGGGFGVMTKVVLRAHYYPTEIWSGMIIISRRHALSLANHIEKYLALHPHPKVNFFMYLVPERLLSTYLEVDESFQEDVFVLHVYDALGEKHGREVFRWALDIKGAIDRTRVTNMRGIVEMQHAADQSRGTMKTFYAPMGVSSLSRDDILRAIEWYDKLATIDKNIQELSVVIFEFQIIRPPLGGISEVAWARPIDMQHLLLIVASAPKDSPAEQENTIRNLLMDAPKQILGNRAKEAQVNPAGLEPDYHDPKATYGQHYKKLVNLRKKYDPERRFKGLVNPKD
ncbi:hypothetical protein B0J12DRAFT_752280 [Macrophomina phaseolina]|uniref:FAD-binding PCMH-type domain-containing protein n=1 Tax=Macrophomina phaseolina TaxID=35725 RepID=A0ABQ8FQX7_9PEZI|nr:hypothetical protein B0J12DRAFT_752280 [Macrophomina phaseolina]